MFRRALALVAVTITCAAGLSTASSVVSAEAAVAAADDARGAFTPVQGRLADTRSGQGVRKGVLKGGSTLTVTPGGGLGIPTTGVSGVVLNLTVTGPTANTYLTAYPSGQSRPTVSSINVVRGETRANLITVRPGSTGKVSIFNFSGSTHVVVDVVGYYRSGGTLGASTSADFHLVDRERYFDTRNDPQGALRGGECITMRAGYEDYPQIGAYSVNVTATGATASGFLTVQPDADRASTGSSLNYTRGSTLANTAIVRSSSTTDGGVAYPSFAVCNSSNGSTHAIVDVVGLYTPVGADFPFRFKALTTPARILDSRRALGVRGALAPRQTKEVAAGPSVAGDGTYALVGNLTVVTPSASTYFTTWPAQLGLTRPPASDVNAAAGRTVANGAVIEIGSANSFNLYNNGGTAHALFDVVGTFEAFTSPTAGREATAGRSAAPVRGDVASSDEAGPRAEAGSARAVRSLRR